MTKAHISRLSATHHPRDQLITYYLACFDKQTQKQEMCLTEEAPSKLIEDLEPDNGPGMTMGGLNL